jgi:hypothetical protein
MVVLGEIRHGSQFRRRDGARRGGKRKVHCRDSQEGVQQEGMRHGKVRYNVMPQFVVVILSVSIRV